MQGGPDPALPQTFLEQQPGGAGVSPGQEGGTLVGQGPVFPGKKRGVPAEQNLLTVAVVAIR